MSNHAFLSPSGSARWLNCTPSAMFESEFPSSSDTAAAEGTDAHAFCEHKLKKALRRRSKRPISDYDNDEMQEYTDDYVDYVLEQLELAKQTCKDPMVLIEQKVDLSEYILDCFGTADCLIVSDDTLQIIDFKYGFNRVLADGNTQLSFYSLGALNIFDSLYDIKEVKMHIFQPRLQHIDCWSISVEDLKAWAEEILKPKAQMAINGEGEYNAGPWCQYCRAAVKCRARAEDKLRLARMEFKKPPLLTDEEIEEVLIVLPDLTKWADEIFAYASDSAIHHGKEWKGYKVVESTTKRKYKDENAVAQAAKDHDFTDIYRQSLIPMTEMQKLMGKKQFDEILGELIVKPQSKPTLAPITDKHPAINVTNATNEFKMED